MFDNEFYMIPQQLTGWAQSTDGSNTNNGAYISVLCQIKNGSIVKYPTSGSGYAWAAIPISPTWSAGHKYVYTLKFFANGNGGAGFVDPDETGGTPGSPIITNSNIIVNVDITPWDNQSSDNVNVDY